MDTDTLKQSWARRDFAEVPNGNFGVGPPLTLKAENGRILVYRDGRLVGFCADGKCIRVADDG